MDQRNVGAIRQGFADTVRQGLRVDETQLRVAAGGKGLLKFFDPLEDGTTHLRWPRQLRPIASNEDFLKIIEPLLDLRLFEAFRHDGQHGRQSISLDRVDLLAAGMPIDSPDLDGDLRNAIQPTDARATLVGGNLPHVLGRSALLIAHLSFFDAFGLLGRAAYGADFTDGL
jgi:hypothetical protein